MTTLRNQIYDTGIKLLNLTSFSEGIAISILSYPSQNKAKEIIFEKRFRFRELLDSDAIKFQSWLFWPTGVVGIIYSFQFSTVSFRIMYVFPITFLNVNEFLKWWFAYMCAVEFDASQTDKKEIIITKIK